jgi:hypothetical protein
MDKHDRDSEKKKSERIPPPDDESHIIRSENSISPNKELYGESKSAEKAEHNEKKSISSDPASFPGGKMKNEPKVLGRKRAGLQNN